MNLSIDREPYLSSKKVKVKVAQLCPAFCNRMDYTIHGALQARILEWVAFPFSRGSSQPRDQTQVSHIAGRFFTSWATREAHIGHSRDANPNHSEILFHTHEDGDDKRQNKDKTENNNSPKEK